MRGHTVTIEMPLKRGKVSKTIPLYQYDYGQKLLFSGIELPQYYEVDFSNELHGNSISQLGDDTGVEIPDSLLATGKPVYLWMFLHDEVTDGETEFQGVIPVIKRAEPSDQDPTPTERTIIAEAIAALDGAWPNAVAAQHAAEAAQAAAETAQGKAEDAQGAAETAQGAAETAQTAAETAQGKAEDAQGAAETAQGAAEDAQSAAESASGTAVDAKDTAVSKAGEAYTSAQSAASSAQNADRDALKSEGYAIGCQNGAPVSSTSLYYQNNAEYFKGEASDSATAAAGHAIDAHGSALEAEGFAVGEQSGTPVTSESPYYQDNAKYYKEQAASSATSASNSASAASGSATSAGASALEAEGYANGQQNGVDVGSDSPYYHDNAKYWSAVAEDAAESIIGFIDDTAGAGDTDKVWSADKSALEVANIEEDVSDLNSAIKNLSMGTIYGFHIDSNESDPDEAVTYRRDAVGLTPAGMDYTNNKFNYGSWGDAFFMPKPCMLKYDGTVDYYLDPDDYSKKADGTASDVANTSYAGNAMMEWGQNGRKIWYAIVPDAGDNTSATVYIADYKVDDRFHAWSFINGEGKYVDHFYTPCYFGTLVDSTLRSLSGQSGSNRSKFATASAERTAAKKNNPTGVDIWDTEVYADITLINLLLVLMGKSLNTQAVFGQGLHTGGSNAVNDSFTSGQHDAKGLFFGTNSGAAGTYTNAVKVFGMENYWGFMCRRFAGLVNVSGTAKYKMTRGTQDGSTASDYVVSDTGSNYAGYLEASTLPASNGAYVGQMQFDGNQMVPKTVGGTSMDASHYYCDGLWTASSGQARYALRGGASTHLARVGAFYLEMSAPPTNAYGDYGAAPSCKPLS